MKSGRLLLTISLFLILLPLYIGGCSSEAPLGGEDPITVSTLEVVAVPDTINPNETTTIRAIAYDDSGNTIADVQVTFTLDDPTMASIDESATTGTDGVAQVHLTARDKTGDVTVSASSDDVTKAISATVTILGEIEVPISALEAVADPEVINPNNTTTIQAIAYDASGNPLSGKVIVFTLDDPTLAYITGMATTDNDGTAQVLLTARNALGTVNVTATSEEIVSDPPVAVIIQDGEAPSQILLSVTPASVVAEGTANVEAQVLDANGDAVADGTLVSFTSDNPDYGNFTTTSATTTNGFATATFKAENKHGATTVTINCFGISAQTSLTVYPAQTATIEFVSADPQRIAIRGSGSANYPDFSVLQFVVKDSNGNPVNGEAVHFALSGPGAGEYLGDTQGVEEIDVSTDTEGIAEVTLHSGDAAGPATIMGSITVTGSQNQEFVIQQKSSVVSIGGGIPSDHRFSVAATVLNLPGLNENGVETSITAYLADRFGNHNILPGTTVSFICERGLAIDTSDVTVDENGRATAIAYTQWPSNPIVEDDVIEQPWETELLDYIYDRYGAELPFYSYGEQHHPREGLVSVLVYVKGEEHFWDVNGNGIYDFDIDHFTTSMDTFDDPFIDANDNLGYTDLNDADPMELYIDAAGDGVWSGRNYVWDEDKNIFTNFKILLTSEPYLVVADDEEFDVNNGGSHSFSILVCDINGNWLTADSKVTVSATEGDLVGPTSFEFPDNIGLGPLEMNFTLYDDDPDTYDTKPFRIEVTVEWKGAYSALEGTWVVARGNIQ